MVLINVLFAFTVMTHEQVNANRKSQTCQHRHCNHEGFRVTLSSRQHFGTSGTPVQTSGLQVSPRGCSLGVRPSHPDSEDRVYSQNPNRSAGSLASKCQRQSMFSQRNDGASPQCLSFEEAWWVKQGFLGSFWKATLTALPKPNSYTPTKFYSQLKTGQLGRTVPKSI